MTSAEGRDRTIRRRRVEQDISADEARGRLALTSARALEALPSKEQCEGFPNAIVQGFLLRLRDMAVDGTRAESWSEDDLDSFVAQLEFADLAFETGIAYASFGLGGFGLGVGGTPRSCTWNCREEKNTCLKQCCPDGCGWGCWCCADCRFAYLACLADCIYNVADHSWGIIMA